MGDLQYCNITQFEKISLILYFMVDNQLSIDQIPFFWYFNSEGFKEGPLYRLIDYFVTKIRRFISVKICEIYYPHLFCFSQR